MRATIPLRVIQDRAETRRFDFKAVLQQQGLNLPPLPLKILQINITRLCNQACRHCHVDASPIRTEQMDRETMDACLDFLVRHPQVSILDITGGAPELNPHFDDLVVEVRRLGRHVMVRHNLIVTLDGNPQTGESKEYLPSFYAQHQVEVISSLPYYQEFFTDRQRGRGVFKKSLESLRRLNRVGYGIEGSGLILDLVYNPVGAFLPPPQKQLQDDFKQELLDRYGIHFNNLWALTNMPINRFAEQLKRNGNYQEYIAKLVDAFNPQAASNLMCRTTLSVGYDGQIYDCDFNQMLGLAIRDGKPLNIKGLELDQIQERQIRFGVHCFGCTAGSGSSCGGAIT